MEMAGIRLHSYLSIKEILDVCHRLGKVDSSELTEIMSYLESE
jgi:hypothetical protein